MRSTTLLTIVGLSLCAMPACSRHQAAPAPAPRRTASTATARPAATKPAATKPAATTSSGVTKANAEAFADELITRTNAERRKADLGPLTRSINLMRAAEIQANQMAKRDMLEHDIPGSEYPTLGTRLTAVQYPMKAAGENIGEGYHSPAAAVAGWMASAGHRANILSSNYTEIGTAMAPGPNGTVFWVQVFGRR